MDRFPGLDRIEDRTHINYGVQTGYYTDDGDEFSTFIGQSYRLDSKDNPFQNGSGLEDQTSDIVGQINALFGQGQHNLNYRFQLNGQNLNATRHEVYGSTEFYNTNLSGVYLYERGAKGTEFTNSREQLQAYAKHQINENWSVSTGVLYDLGQDSGLRESEIGVGYDDDCFGVTVTVDRNLQSTVSGANDTSIFARLRLKNLGEFETKAYSASSSDSTAQDDN